MGEVIEGRWADPHDLGVFPPNCSKCLIQMQPGEVGWLCPSCGLVKIR
jgi:hypothetical protein